MRVRVRAPRGKETEEGIEYLLHPATEGLAVSGRNAGGVSPYSSRTPRGRKTRRGGSYHAPWMEWGMRARKLPYNMLQGGVIMRMWVHHTPGKIQLVTYLSLLAGGGR